MSLSDFQGSAYAVQQLMRSAQQDIDTGARRGAERRYPKADDRQRMTWRDQLLARVERQRTRRTA